MGDDRRPRFFDDDGEEIDPDLVAGRAAMLVR